jgi:hypothetical protein
MNKKIIYLIIFAGLFGLAVFVSAQSITNPLGVSTFPALIEKIAGAVRDIVASLAVLMLIIAGIYFLLSAGSPNMLSKAKAALMYAIIGGAIGLAAQGLVTL